MEIIAIANQKGGVGKTTTAVNLSGGPYRDNRQIGMARAVAVADFLVRDAGLPTERVLAASNGELNPPFPNDNPDDKPKNRTVTLRLLASPPGP